MKTLARYLALVGVLLFLAAPCLARAYRTSEVPNVQLLDRTRFVSNPDGILSQEAVARIDRICDSLRQERLAEVAVVAVREMVAEQYANGRNTVMGDEELEIMTRNADIERYERLIFHKSR